MLCETVVFKIADFLKIFAALERHDCETISSTIFCRNDDVILLAAIACFMRRELTGVTIPARRICQGSSKTISG